MSESEIAPPRRKRQVQGRRVELLPRRAVDACTVEKSRGRLEIREVWVVAADELEAYLAEEWGWQGVRQLGWIRRLSRRRPSDLWSVEQVTIVSSRRPEQTPPTQLLNLVRADRAYFGEKDYQQLRTVVEMAEEFFVGTEIVACPTVRTATGLAESSRNRLLTEAGLAKAAEIHRILCSADSAEAATGQLKAQGFRVDYVEEHWGRRFAAAARR